MSDDHLTSEEDCPDCSGFDHCDFHAGMRRGGKQIENGDYTTLEEAEEVCEKSGKEVIVCREGCGGIFDSWVVFYEHRCEDTAEGGDGAPDNGSQSRASAALEQETSKAETLEDLRIPEDGSINTLIGKLVAHYLSEDDSPEDVDAHKETYNAAIDHVEDVVRRRKQRVLETGEMPEERKVVRVDELNALLGDVSQKGGME